MGRYITKPNQSVASLTGVLPVSQGGTGVPTRSQAVGVLDGIDRDTINKPLGILGLDSQGLVPAERLHLNEPGGVAALDERDYFAASVLKTANFNAPTIKGPLTCYAQDQAHFIITNYDAAMTYALSSTSGIITRTAETIAFTPPVTGVATFTINGKTITVQVFQKKVKKPSIAKPIALSNISSGEFVFESTAFQTDSSTPDTHQASSWQIATDAGFTTITHEALNSTNSLNSWTVSTLSAGYTYYVRVRHTGATLGASEWSSVVSFTTTDVNVTGPAQIYTGLSGTYTITNYDTNTIYSVDAVVGTVSRTGATVTYTAPMTAGVAGFTINGKSVTVTALASSVAKPSITSPADASTSQSQALTITSSSFASVGYPDTHQASSWQLSTDSQFTTMTKSVVDSVTELTSWDVAGLTAATTYYVRTRQLGSNTPYSVWSTASSFTTA